MEEQKILTTNEIVEVTKGFIRLADQLLHSGKLTIEEYDDLTFVKKDFLIKIEKEKQQEIERCI
ncbi:MAG: hypothetical protein ACRCSG_05405 [Cellulosilyticaceae bacterium]